jgi:ketosteroid isomerase-like protein
MTSVSFTKGITIFVTGALLGWMFGPMPLRADPPAVVAGPQEVQAEHNRQIVTAAFDRWADGGTDFFSEMLSPDIVWTIEGSGPSAGTYRGLDDFMARAVRPFVSRLRSPVRPVDKRVWADGDHVIINWEGEAVALDGRPYRNRYVWIFRMAGGKAAECSAFLDLAPYDDVIRRIPAPLEGSNQ